MTNLEKWRSYTDGLPTPDRMIDWAFYSMIASALQRRVWLDSNNDPVFLSNYIFFVSPPGIGKTLVINKVEEILRHWKHGDNQSLLEAKFSDTTHKAVVEGIIERDGKVADKATLKSSQEDSEIVRPYLIPIAADATTYEALVLNFGKCYRRINFKIYNAKAEKDIIQVYGHSSLCFLLKELGSLLRKRTNDTVTLLLGLYDCPTDYEYDTVTREKDRIRKGCLNILGATNPEFMNEIFNEKLIDPAFLSRSIFVYASKNRKPVSKIQPLSKEQLDCQNDLKQHVLKLTTLYGLVEYDPGVDELVHEWFIKHEEQPHLRASQSPKLQHYYSRKLLHLKKLAGMIHFGETCEMKIGLEPFRKAIDVLNKEEKFMHLALTLDAKDKGAIVSKAILEALTPDKELNKVDLVMHLYQAHGIQDNKAYEDAMTFLYDTGQIRCSSILDEVTGQDVTYWRLK